MIKPLNNNVLVQYLKPEDKIISGIIIPEMAQQKPQEAKVIEVGYGKQEGGKTIDFQVKPGDLILTAKTGGTEIKYGEEVFMLVREDDILAILNAE